ncbi:hypothetical protein JCM17478_08640 [Thermopirellula anaerolimosa]
MGSDDRTDADFLGFMDSLSPGRDIPDIEAHEGRRPASPERLPAANSDGFRLLPDPPPTATARAEF